MRRPPMRNGCVGSAHRSCSSSAPTPPDDDEVALLLERYRRYQHEHHDRLTRCYDDVPEVIAALAERRAQAGGRDEQGLAHCAPEPRVRGLDDFFPVVVGYDDTTRHKPDPEPVRVALSRLGVSAGQRSVRGGFATRHPAPATRPTS